MKKPDDRDFIDYLESTPLNPEKGRRRRVGHSLLRMFVLFSLFIGSLATAQVYFWLDEIGIFDLNPKNLDTIITYQPADNSIVYDRHGVKIGEFFSRYHSYLPYEEIPKPMIQAILAIEDRKFFSHYGVDPLAIGRAILVQIKKKGYRQGASTITQQLVRHFLLTKEKNIIRKIKELVLAIMLEQRLSKERILELYANTLFLGNGAYGVGAASLRYFNRPLTELKPHEMAMIAGLFQSPSRYNPHRFPERARKRQLRVIRALTQAGYINGAEAENLAAQPLEYQAYRSINQNVAPFFVDYIEKQARQILSALNKRTVKNQGLRIYTTLDLTIQKQAEQSLLANQDLLAETEEKSSLNSDEPVNIEAAILSVDPKTGEIIAMVGGRDYQSSQFNRTVTSMRSPGSAFKPIVYSQALQSGWKWSDVLYVSPISVGTYRPRTPRSDYFTETTLLRSFYRSMNTTTIEVGQKLGLKQVLEHATALGIQSPLKEEFGSLIGGSDVTMIDLARVYSTYANGGKKQDPYGIEKIVNREGKVIYDASQEREPAVEAISPQLAYLMTEGMRAVFRHGTGRRKKEWSRMAAGKTGTSNDAKDNWFCGYTTSLATMVWVGSDDHAPLSKNSGGNTLALPIWSHFMEQANELRPGQGFRRPPGVVAMRVHPKFGNRSRQGIIMYFTRNNTPGAVATGLEFLETGASRNLFGG